MIPQKIENRPIYIIIVPSDNRMARRAIVTGCIYELYFPNGLPQLIAEYADWDIEEKMTEMFRVNSRRTIRFTDHKSGFNIYIKHNSENYVTTSGSILRDLIWMHSSRARRDFAIDLDNGIVNALRYVEFDKKDAADILKRMIIDRWNSL